MVCTYEEYLKQPKAITFGKMQIFHAEMLAEIGADTEALELYDELMKVATRYAAIRANWLLLTPSHISLIANLSFLTQFSFCFFLIRILAYLLLPFFYFLCLFQLAFLRIRIRPYNILGFPFSRIHPEPFKSFAFS